VITAEVRPTRSVLRALKTIRRPTRDAVILGACLAAIWALAGSFAPAADRNQVLEIAASMPTGARLIETAHGAVLVATATVPIPEDPRADRAYGSAATAAMIEARAEAALFLGGVHSSTSRSVRNEVSDSESTKRETWIRTQIASLARVRLTNGEPLDVSRVDGGVRAIFAWGLEQPSMRFEDLDSAALGIFADEALAKADLPSREYQWGSRADGSEGLFVVLAVFPDGGLKAPCEALGPDSLPCGSCRHCREEALEHLLRSMISGWSRAGDVSVARSLTRVGRYTVLRARDGAESVTRATSRILAARTGAELEVHLPPESFAHAKPVYRHGEKKSVCVAFVPMLASRAPATSERSAKPR
jgi:hypothetical protein